MANNFSVIDGDTHIVEMDWQWDKHLDAKYRDLVGRFVVRESDGREVLVREGQDAIPIGMEVDLGPGNGTVPRGMLMDEPVRWENVPKAAWDPGERLRIMDQQDTDIGVFFPTMANSVAPHNFKQEEAARAICRAYNHIAAEFCDADRSRLYAAAMVPHAYPAVAAEEARYAVEELGLCAVLWPPQVVNGRPLTDPANDVLFKAVESLGVPLILHISFYGPCNIVGYDMSIGGDFFHWVTMGHIAQNQAALLQLMTGDFPGKYPDLKVGLFEGGVGWAPYMLERMDEYWEYIAFAQRQIPKKPSEWFKEHRIMLGGEAEELVFEGVAEELEKHLIFAGDYPHFDCDERGPADILEADFSESTKKAILQDNPAEFFGIKPVKRA